MSDFRKGLSNEQRNKLRNDLANSIKNDHPRNNAGVHTSTNSGTRISGNSEVRSSGYGNTASNDRARLKAFASKYEPTRKIYYEMSSGYSGLQSSLHRLKASKNDGVAIVIMLILGGIVGFVIGSAIGLIFDTLGADDEFCSMCAMSGILAGAILFCVLRNKGINKKIKKVEVQLQEKTAKYMNALKKMYDSTNKAVSFPYASPYIVDKLLEYMDNGRCDTVKECLNLYEQEKMQYEQMQWLRHIGKEVTYSNLATQYLAFDTWMKNMLS